MSLSVFHRVRRKLKECGNIGIGRVKIKKDNFKKVLSILPEMFFLVYLLIIIISSLHFYTLATLGGISDLINYINSDSASPGKFT